mgnify:CR=1 FL=1
MVERKRWVHKKDEDGNLARFDIEPDPEPSEAEKLDEHVKKLNKKIYGW